MELNDVVPNHLHFDVLRAHSRRRATRSALLAPLRGDGLGVRGWGECLLQLVFSWALFFAAATPLVAQDDFDPVTSAGDSLRGARDLPWYDADKDDIQSVPVKSPDEPPPRPTSGKQVTTSENQGDSELRGSTVGIWYFIQGLGWLAIAAVIIVIFMFILSALLNGRATVGTSAPVNLKQTQVDRVDELPVPLKRATSDLLGELRRQYELGNYNEATIYLYSYLLVELDKANRIRLVRGKTNRQYLGELRESPALVDLVGQTMIAFEDAFFGNRTLTRERFEACYQRLEQFHAELELVVA